MTMPAWVSEVGVAASVAVAVLAIWGDRIRSALLRPRLQLELLSTTGELTTQVEQLPGSPARFFAARYYHMRVTNLARFPVAHEVQVLLTHFETRGPDGRPATHLSGGALPLMWRNQPLHQISRAIGHATVADADLLFVREDFLQLTLMLVPNNLAANMRGDTHFWVTLVARGLEGESRSVRLQIDWDGKWDRGDTEMSRHVRISQA
jgi:hypothetical protein